MTANELHALATADPVPNLSKRWGEIAADTRRKVHALEDALRELDQVTGQLADHDLVVATDLGVTGNAARNAFTAAQLDKGMDTFVAPHSRVA